MWLVNVLRTTASLDTAHLTPHELDGLVSRLARHHLHDRLDNDDDVDDNFQAPTAAIYRMHVNSPPTLASTTDFGTAIHPVVLPFRDMLSIGADLSLPSKLASPSPTIPVRLQVTQGSQDGIHLADSGATVSATGLCHLLHDFTATTQYEITGYDGVATPAHGQGYAHVLNPLDGSTERIFFVYTPTVAGTIISLEHHARMHPRIHRWTQEAVPSSDQGWITFYSTENEVVSRYQTERSNGLYYIQNLTFLPVLPACTINMLTMGHDTPLADMTSAPLTGITSDDATVPTSHVDIPHPSDFCQDFDIGLNLPNSIAALQASTAPLPNPLVQQLRPLPHLSATEKDIVHYHTWHQRLAHCSEDKLRRKQKLVDGMPPFSKSRLPDFVTCRACDIAKLRRAPRGHSIDDPPDLRPAQIFQMDLGLFRGPANLHEVVTRQADPQPKLIESRQGFVCYLLIIDRATCYMWVFPLKSKSVSHDLLNIFFTTHGYRDRTPSDHRFVYTASNGSLAESPEFHTMVARHGYSLQKTERFVRTDGEGSLVEPPSFRTMVTRHGYSLQKTAADTSSQNGMAERPHQTLGTTTRCLLYSSGMHIRFWADALVYATYVYNRLYHSGINGIPYTQWTGKRPNLKHLRAFGAKVIVKRSGHRPTKADPHFYDGRFLRFGGTTRNLVYFDEVTHRDKYARHVIMDEFHYGDATRPPGATQLFEAAIPACTDSALQDNEQDVLLEVTGDTDHHSSLEDACTVHAMGPTHVANLPLATPPATAAAAVTRVRQHEDAVHPDAPLHLTTSSNMYTPLVSIILPMNRHPTLGLLFTPPPSSALPGQHPLLLVGCQEGTKASRLPYWRSQICHSILQKVNDTWVHTLSDFLQCMSQARQQGLQSLNLQFAKVEVRSTSDDDIPQLHFDQLRHIHAIRHQMSRATVRNRLHHTITLTRTQLKKRDDHVQWKEAEWSQHNKCRQQGMFGDPIPRPIGAVVLPFVWTYLTKLDPLTGATIYKARGTCNGGKRFGKAVTLAETYATCVEQPACRLFWALTAALGLIVLGADAGNAFAEAPPPVEPFYMQVDDQFREWWTECLHSPPPPLALSCPCAMLSKGIQRRHDCGSNTFIASSPNDCI